MGGGEINWQCCEGVMDRVDEQRPWGDVTEMKHNLNKMRLQWGHSQHLHFNKEVPARHHYREIPQPPF